MAELSASAITATSFQATNLLMIETTIMYQMKLIAA
jgi:hypothetical protein